MCLSSDLFGDIPVYFDDVELWLDLVPKIPRFNVSRRAYYAANWNVVKKIQNAKVSGLWDELLTQHADAHAHDLEQTTAHLFRPVYLPENQPKPHRLVAIIHGLESLPPAEKNNHRLPATTKKTAISSSTSEEELYTVPARLHRLEESTLD